MSQPGTRAPYTRVVSAAVLLPRDNIDTDQVIPGRFLKGVDRSGMADGLFADWRYSEDGSLRPDFVLNLPESAGREVLVVGDNFGCGSSREHAPWALLGWGIRAVVASSFADIFRVNALKNGLLPVVVSPDTLRQITRLLTEQPGADLAIDLEAQTLTLPDGTAVAFTVDPFARRMLLDGTDELGYLLNQEAAIAAYESRHPAPVSTLTPD